MPCLHGPNLPQTRSRKMTSSHKDPVLVVLQLTGGNDYLNTVIPRGTVEVFRG